MELPKLMPCPFCGGRAVMRKSMGSSQAYYVKCVEGDVLTQIFATPERAVKIWNTRVSPDAKHDDVQTGCILQSNASAHEAEEEIRR